MNAVHKSARPLELKRIFIKRMKGVKQLRDQLTNDQLVPLLHALYDHMLQKIKADAEIAEWSTVVSKISKGRELVGHFKKGVTQAAGLVDRLTTEFKVLIEYRDALRQHKYDRHSLAMLNEAAEFLAFLQVEIVANIEVTLALQVHPALRTPKEWRILELYGLGGQPKCPFLKTKTAIIDHWFIGAAADCLDECEKLAGTRIGVRAPIIRNLFEAMGQARTDASIEKELQRQKTQGRPEALLYCLPQDDVYKVWARRPRRRRTKIGPRRKERRFLQRYPNPNNKSKPGTGP
jgi:hypothetical protein